MQSGYRLLAIEAAHLLGVADHPALHNDPFDRLLAAQALSEPLRMMTHGDQVARHSDTVVTV